MLLFSQHYWKSMKSQRCKWEQNSGLRFSRFHFIASSHGKWQKQVHAFAVSIADCCFAKLEEKSGLTVVWKHFSLEMLLCKQGNSFGREKVPGWVHQTFFLGALQASKKSQCFTLSLNTQNWIAQQGSPRSTGGCEVVNGFINRCLVVS